MIKTSRMESENKMDNVDNVYNDMMCVKDEDECSKMLKDIKLLPIDKVDSFNYDLLENKPSRYFQVWLCLISIKPGGWEKDAPCFYDLVPGYVKL